jgi:hypothetical protein
MLVEGGKPYKSQKHLDRHYLNIPFHSPDYQGDDADDGRTVIDATPVRLVQAVRKLLAEEATTGTTVT